MGWFSRKPSIPNSAAVGAFLADYIPSLIGSPGPVQSLREMLGREGVAVDAEDDFDLSAFFFVVFTAYAVARRHFAAQVADEILTATLAPMMEAGDDTERELVRGRFEWFQNTCPPVENRGTLLASLVYVCCVSIFDNEGDDAFFRLEASAAVAGLFKMFDDLFAGMTAGK
jgi:hypothetical protein